MANQAAFGLAIEPRPPGRFLIERVERGAEKWVGDALFRPESAARWRALLNLGMTDAQRAISDEPGLTFWDFKTFGWERKTNPYVADLLWAVLIKPEFQLIY